MLEIILLIFLVKNIGEVARSKGLSVWKWRLAAVLAWIGIEIPVALFSMIYTQNLLVANISGILAGLLGYFIVRHQLDKAPPRENQEPY